MGLNFKRGRAPPGGGESNSRLNKGGRVMWEPPPITAGVGGGACSGFVPSLSSPDSCWCSISSAPSGTAAPPRPARSPGLHLKGGGVKVTSVRRLCSRAFAARCSFTFIVIDFGKDSRFFIKFRELFFGKYVGCDHLKEEEDR